MSISGGQVGAEGLIHRNTNYNNATGQLKEPFLQKNTPQSSSNRNLFWGENGGGPYTPRHSAQQKPFEPPSPANNRSGQQPLPTPTNNASAVNWMHNNRTLFQQIANNEPVDPNVVVIPKHPAYLSKLFRPDPKQLASNESFNTLCVETLALCVLMMIVDGIFAPEHFALILLITAGCVLTVLGFIGALRRIKVLIQVFFYGMAAWLGVIIIAVFAVLFASNTVYDDAILRCENAPDYVMKFNTDPATKALIDCSINMHKCFLNCVYSVEKHLTIGYFVFGGVVALCLVIFMFHLHKEMKKLIFSEDAQKVDEDDDDYYDDDSEYYDEEDDEPVDDDASNYPVELNFHGGPTIRGQVDNDDIIVTTSNPLHDD